MFSIIKSSIEKILAKIKGVFLSFYKGIFRDTTRRVPNPSANFPSRLMVNVRENNRLLAKPGLFEKGERLVRDIVSSVFADLGLDPIPTT